MKILLAVDGSKYSGWATELVLGLPLVKEPEILVIHVLDLMALTHPLMTPPIALGYSEAMRREVARSMATADRLVSRCAGRLRRKWRNVIPAVEKGNVAERILAKAKGNKVDLIVLGSRGLSNIPAFLMGSISQKVATYASCSVLVVRKKSPRVRKVLLAMDGSQGAHDALKFLKRHFRPGSIRTTVLNVREPLVAIKTSIAEPIEKKYSRELVHAGFRANAAFAEGHPSVGIIRTARRLQPDFVLVGSRGLTGIKQFLLGSVSQKVIKYAHASILVVRAPGG